MHDCYVSVQDGAYLVGGTRVSLDSLVSAWANGQTAKAIAAAFPLLNLEQVYGALTYYLAHRQEVDAYVLSARSDYAQLRQAARGGDPQWCQALAAARRHAA